MGVALLAAALLVSLRLLREPAPGQPEAPDAADAPDAAAPALAWRRLALPLAPVAVLGGLMESGVSAMLPSISMRVGFDIATAAWLGAVIGAGSALLQSPFGALADRFGLRRTMALAWALILLATAALLLGAAQPQHVLWGVGFVLGGVGGAVYTLIVIELSHRLAGGALVKAMGLLVTAYTGGTVGGPVLGGWLFDAAGLHGLALALLACGLLGAALAWRALRPAARHPMLPA
jgi:MFS family permease